jgi:uncharacterized protein
VQAVLDPNVIISGLLSAQGTAALLLRALEEGKFDVVVSPQLIAELTRALAYPKLRAHISQAEAAAALTWMGDTARFVPDPDEPAPVRCRDSGDDYLIALASAHRVALVSGDKDLLDLAGEIPVLTPREFLELLSPR